ncbi:MAG: hypothetical protein ABIQ08_08075 [Duganella sp.]
MELDILLKSGTLLLGVVGAGKILYDLSIIKRSRMRDEYTFAKTFFEEVSSNAALHPFLREKGYQAIAGDRQLSGDEIEYLLSLEKPDRALRDYVLGRTYLEHLPQSGNLQIEFKKRHKSKWSRKWRVYVYSGSYVIFSLTAFSPLVLSQLFAFSNAQTVQSLILSVSVFGPYGWYFLKTAAYIYRAQKLVENQHRHTKRILVTGLAAVQR